jgi:hypothetical protein
MSAGITGLNHNTQIEAHIKFFFFFLIQGLHLEPALFCDGFFRDRVSQTIFLGWFQTEILLIAAS